MALDRTNQSLWGRWWWTVDRLNLGAIVILMLLGSVLVAAGSLPVARRIGLPGFYFVHRHQLFLALGFVAMLITSMLSPTTIRRLAVIGFLGSVALLLLVPFFGDQTKGAHRWITLAGISIQPSEFMKPCFAVVIAWICAESHKRVDFPAYKLAIALYHDFPQDTPYFATKEFVFRGRVVRGHNHLMDRYPGMDGLKAGFTDASGFNLASTAVRDGQRLFAVVMGGRTAAARDQLMARLLDDGFENRSTPAILVAQAGGARSGIAHRVLAALSPIDSADAETVPASPPHHHHRRGRSVPVARVCTPHRGVICPRRNVAAHPHPVRSASRLAHRNAKKPVVVASNR